MNEITNAPKTQAVAKANVAEAALKNIGKLVEEGSVKVPTNYDLGNEVRHAYYTLLQKSEMRTATPISIVQALEDMAIQGLEIRKNHCYFIKYGDKCTLFRSYFGDVAVAKRTGLVLDIKANVVREGDEFEVGIVNDQEAVTKHETEWANHDKPIIAAYAVAILPDGQRRYCIMSNKEIQVAWAKSTNGGKTAREFPQEMSKRTVIRRLTKMIFNAANSDDKYLGTLVEAFNRTTSNEYEDVPPADLKAKSNVANSIIPEEEQTFIDVDFDDQSVKPEGDENGEVKGDMPKEEKTTPTNEEDMPF